MAWDEDAICQIKFLGLDNLEDNECIHLTARWTNKDDDVYCFVLDTDCRTNTAPEGGWKTSWESSCFLSVRDAKVLHAWLGFMLGQIDSGALKEIR